MEKNTEAIIHQFERIINKYNLSEKKPRHYSTEYLLHRSEVHTIDAIGNNTGINVTELARYLGITKGGVSQMIDKLIKKNLVIKTPLSENEVSLKLTDEGKKVFDGHRNYHEAIYSEMSNLIEKLPNESLNAFAAVFNALEGFLDKKL